MRDLFKAPLKLMGGEWLRLVSMGVVSVLVTLLLVGDGGLGRWVLVRDFIGVGYYQVGDYGYSNGTYYGAYGLPQGQTTPVAATSTATPTSTSTTAPTAVVVATSTPAPSSGGSTDDSSATSVPATSVPATSVPATAAAATSAPATSVPSTGATAAAGTSVPSSGTPQAVPSTGGTVSGVLPGGQTVQLLINPTNLAGLAPGTSIAVIFDSAPTGLSSVQEGSLGGGNSVPAGRPVYIQITAVTTSGGTVTSLTGTFLDQPITIRLPVIAPPPGTAGASNEVGFLRIVQVPGRPSAADAVQFAWLRELKVDGKFAGYLRPPAVFDPPTNSLNISLPVSELQGTLFLPVFIQNAYVQNHAADAHIFSGPTSGAVDFGPAGPQFTTFVVVAPQVLDRLYVYNSASGNYGWIEVSGVGPSGPPTSTVALPGVVQPY